MCFRNESYIARVRLTVIDYNAHVEREVARNRAGDIIYHRKYRKQTKKWDVTPVHCRKDYSYMNSDILQLREGSDSSSRSK